MAVRAPGWVVATLGLSGCLVRVDGHCGNNGGDAACGGATPYCDVCTLDNDGCMPAVPAMACRAPGSEGQTTGGGGSSSDDGSDRGSSSTAPPECMVELGPDPDCPVDAPYCSAGECHGCADFDGGFCGSIDAEVSACDLGSGACVECTSSPPDCAGDEPYCAPDQICRGCWKHEQCPDSACNGETGLCTAAADVVWVDATACPTEGTGTALDPFCEIGSALALASPGRALTVRVRPGSYVERVSVAFGRIVAIRGEGEGVQLSSGAYEVVVVSGGSELFLTGVEIGGGIDASNTDAIVCQGSRLWLEDVVVTPNIGNGIHVTGPSVVHMDRSQIVGREGNAIHLEDMARLEMSSSIVALNGDVDEPTHAVLADDQSSVSLSYSTLAGNRGIGPGASIWCAPGAGGELRNGITASFVGSSVQCASLLAEYNVIDTAVEGTGNFEVAALSPSWFQDVPGGDFHVSNPEQTPFIGLPQWRSGDPYEDVDGQPRVLSNDGTGIVGADVP